MTMKKTDSFRFWRFLALAALFFLVAGCRQALYFIARLRKARAARQDSARIAPS